MISKFLDTFKPTENLFKGENRFWTPVVHPDYTNTHGKFPGIKTEYIPFSSLRNNQNLHIENMKKYGYKGFFNVREDSFNFLLKNGIAVYPEETYFQDIDADCDLICFQTRRGFEDFYFFRNPHLDERGYLIIELSLNRSFCCEVKSA